MRDFSDIYSLPNSPAVYALYGGNRGTKYVAYVGIAGRLKQRITQHLIKRDSSVTTGVSAVCLQPDYVTSMSWWEHPNFSKTVNLKAAEIVAFVVLNPALRSRSGSDRAGQELYSNPDFFSNTKALFEGPPTGTIKFPSLSDSMMTISKLKEQIESLQNQIDNLQCKKEK